MNLNFSIFSKLLSSPPARMIGGLLAFTFLLVQAYYLPEVKAGDKLLVYFVFGQQFYLPWMVCFLFGFLCIISSLLVVQSINSTHRFVDGESFPMGIFLFIGLSSFPQLLLQPEVLFASLLAIIVVYFLLDIYSRSSALGSVFKCGVLCSFASLFYMPSISLLLLILIGFTIFKPFTIRSLFLVIISFALLYSYLFGLSYLFDLKLNFDFNFNFHLEGILNGLFNLINVGLWAIFGVVIVAIVRVYAKQQKMIVRQRNQLLVVFIACLIYFLIGIIFQVSGVLLFLLALSSLFFLFFYQSISKKWMVDLLLIGILIYNSFITIFS